MVMSYLYLLPKNEAMAEENNLDKSIPSSNCVVCEEVTNNHHLHYGAYCCLSCRAFFRRVNQKTKNKEYKCKKSGTCDVSFKNRKSCQRCRYDLLLFYSCLNLHPNFFFRYDKCLAIGMKSNLVLTSEQKKVRFRKKSSESKVIPLQDPGCIKRTFSVECPSPVINKVRRKRTSSCTDTSSAQTPAQTDELNDLTHKNPTWSLQQDTLAEIEATLTSSPFQPQIDLSNLALDSDLSGYSLPIELEVFDQSFKDVSMGDEWLKEFVMFSFDVPLSKHFASTTFRTLRQRFQRILQSNPQYQSLNPSDQDEIWRQGSMKAATLWIIKSEYLESGKDQLHFFLGQDDLCTWQKYYQFNFPKFQQMTLKKVSLVSDLFDSQEIIKYNNISVKLDNLIAEEPAEMFQTMTLCSLYCSVSSTTMSTEAGATFVMKMTSEYFALLKQKVRNVDDEEKIMHMLDHVNDLSNTLSKLNM